MVHPSSYMIPKFLGDLPCLGAVSQHALDMCLKS